MNVSNWLAVHDLSARRQVRLTQRDMDEFERLCNEQGVRPGTQLRHLVREWLAQERAQKGGTDGLVETGDSDHRAR